MNKLFPSEMKSKIILLAIFLIALILRVTNINNNPIALYGDELTITLDSYSLLKTGHDQLGNPLPVTFEMGAGRPAGYVYFSIPFVGLFGPSALGVRGLSIFSGLGIVLLLYYIGRKLVSERVGLISAGIAAFSIWDISLSRGGFEAHFALFLALLGFYLFLIAKQKPYLYIVSALSFGLILHTYPTYKITLPLFLVLLAWFGGVKNYLISKGKNQFLIGCFIFIIIALSSLVQTFTGGSEERFSRINVLSQEEIKSSIEQKINYERELSKLPASLSKVFHNKAVEYGKIIGENYLQNFSFDFLFVHGDRNPRHNLATMGQLYFVEIILILLGLVTFWQQNKKIVLFLSLWIALAPISAAIVDLPHALRSAFMLPPLIILSALGLIYLLQKKNKLLFAVVILSFIIQFIFFSQKLFFLSADEYSNFYAYPARLASEIVLENKDKYDYIFLSDKIDSIEFAFPVYAKQNPEVVISQNKTKTSLGEFQFKKFENVYIGSIPDSQVENFLSSLGKKYLFIGPSNMLEELGDVEVVNSADGLKALVIKRSI